MAMLTQTEVDPADPAFSHPAKFIGPCYSKEEAEKCARRRLRLIDNYCVMMQMTTATRATRAV